MRLNSARALKQEILARPLGAGAAMRTLSRGIRAVSAVQPVPTMEAGFALGIKGKRGNFRLAVRVQVSSPGLGLLLESFRERAKGEIDVRQVGIIHKQQWHRRRNRPLLIGGSIGPERRSYGGTLGCFVVPSGRSTEDAAQILSNNHVLADENNLSRGDHILQPARLDNGRRVRDRCATLARFVRLHRKVNKVDAAVADLNGDISFYYNWLTDLGAITGVRTTPLDDAEIVYKVGRTTGLTKGRISAIEVDRVRIGYDMGTLRFDDQIEIEPYGDTPFSQSGDSGSLIVDARRRAIGLLFAGNDVDVTYGNPISNVLSSLGVDLVY